MHTAISNSTFQGIVGSFKTANIVIDINSFLIMLGLVMLAVAIFSYVNYIRDKDNVPELRKIEQKIDFYSIDLIRINNRLNDLENNKDVIEKLRKSISELKSLIIRRNKC